MVFERFFQEADLNNDREISKTEFITHMNLTTHMDNENWIALFNELDTNKDGVLTYQEFWEKDAIHNSEDLMEALNEFVVSIRTLTHGGVHKIRRFCY